MKRFISTLLAFVLIITLISGVVNFAYVQRDKSDSEFTDKFKTIPSSIKICNFGSSHGLRGFCYEDVTDVECFNFALSGQYPLYDYRLFEYYKKDIEKGAVVFIPVSYFSLYGSEEGTEFLNRNKRYYRILPPEFIKDFDIKTYLYVNYAPALQDGIKTMKMLVDGAENTNEETWELYATDIDVRTDAQIACKRHIFEGKLGDNGERILNQEEIDSIEDMVNSCYEWGCTPILVTTPFLEEYTDEIENEDPDFMDDFYSHIKRIVEDTGVKYYDYAFDGRFAGRYECFKNSDHLNKEGARQFTNILMDEVVHYGEEDSLVK